jgi:hypothetical protein
MGTVLRQRDINALETATTMSTSSLILHISLMQTQQQNTPIFNTDHSLVLLVRFSKQQKQSNSTLATQDKIIQQLLGIKNSTTQTSD